MASLVERRVPRILERTPTETEPSERGQRIELIQNPSGRWTARDEDAGVASQGETRQQALENRGEVGHEPTDEELRDLGVDPAVARSQGTELPDSLESMVTRDFDAFCEWIDRHR